ncbi:MAG: hypothetical protein HY677_04230 [Chloroflexi bacterium]|nr:hypothetical protein [Chloroflexota bacterium]
MRSKRGVVTAITAAVAAFMEAEEQARLAAVQAPRPAPSASLWRLFGRMELMRAHVPGRQRRG